MKCACKIIGPGLDSFRAFVYSEHIKTRRD
ncbi:hypothetical protein 20Sep418_00152 [Pseudomonas phage 20Sep418]|uniref:Uncharacterized protein n=3 Tax=Pakpunavirus TaxID=1921407 RepID=A0AAE9KDV8_9CAUD|nr:hypothetical protein QE347_gp086 [Pseudomonas phage vB_Paer_Ps12]YP_010765379.1 hypothetical protein QE348_gp083 [Pseudomonas phage vB_Paer_PsIn]YP_010765577.1 hypothetical protein QE349_gp084 [Pseudomonas phage vB_Paer_PsCh]UOL47730.1 hypothetical protein vBPaerPs25_86 [Pseudomonas phage vB_Paer_Ps25]WFG37116.1 hypothetical protein 9081_00001 [Pseudomonas phage bmx-p3]WFG37827.1 hypothetical protein 20Sep418_00152 [Pseudomonas phage 20Sep418]UOL47542.1 hypothetical protein vBPaerPs12_86 [